MKTIYGFAVLALAVPLAIRTVGWFTDPSREIDPTQADAGARLFERRWTKNDPLAAGGDGLGPVFNANSCVACHFQGGTGGGGPNQKNVTAFTVRPVGEGEKPRQGVVHAHTVIGKFQETPRSRLTLFFVNVHGSRVNCLA